MSLEGICYYLDGSNIDNNIIKTVLELPPTENLMLRAENL